MAKKSIRHASAFFGAGSAAAKCFAAVDRDLRLLEKARHAMPPPLDQHCLHATIADRVLVLTTDSPAWASRLRFAAPALLKILADRFGPLDAWRVRIQPPGTAGARATRSAARRMSPASVEHLLAAAATLGDEELAAAFRRLARAGGGALQED